MTKNSIRGFTLIELMIVIAIVGIISALAVPQYGQYTKRAKYASVIAKTLPYKTAVTLCIMDENTPLPCDSGYGFIGDAITTPVGHLTSLNVSEGTITAQGTNAVSNAVYKLVPGFNSTTNKITWAVDHSVTNACKSFKLCN